MTEVSGPKDELLDFAALVAHQVRSPIASASTLLRTLISGCAGPVNAQHLDLLKAADGRCQEALRSVARIIEIRQLATEGTARTDIRANLTASCRAVVRALETRAREHQVDLKTDLEVERALVRMAPASMEEMLVALLENAIKYTPAGGRVLLGLTPCPRDPGIVRLSVGDSGIGVPESEREKVFGLFARGSNVRIAGARGTGMGLTFVKALIESVGGRISVGSSELGGAEFTIEMSATFEMSTRVLRRGDEMSRPRRVVVIGGVAAGSKVASKVLRLEPGAEVTVVEKGEVLSYAGCGLPYYVSGVVRDQRELVCTPVGSHRDPVFFQKLRNLKVMNSTEALEIDREEGRIRVRNLIDNREDWLAYDQLALCTGAHPIRPKVPGVDLANVYTLHGVRDAEGIKNALEESRAKDVVVVGGGLIGVEMAEALVHRGARVTVVEKLDQILPILDWEIAKLVENHLEAKGVKVAVDSEVLELLPRKNDAGAIGRVKTSHGELPADLVVLAIGVAPNVELAARAGLTLGTTGAMKVDSCMRTDDPDIYAAGDCVESTNLITGRECHVPLGSTAHKQGRVVAVNVCGGNEEFSGVVGTTICKVFDYAVARTGLSEREAREEGFDAETVLCPGPDRGHFMPSAMPVMLKIVADRASGRLLGVQAVGPGECAKRVDVAATGITAGMTVDQVSKLDLAYAPPYASAMDNVITACNVMKNKLEGRFEGISPMAVKSKLEAGHDFVFLDVRSQQEVEEVGLPEPVHIPLGALRGRLHELDRQKEIIAFCRISLRGYEAALILSHAGFRNVKVMDGGVMMWPYKKIVRRLRPGKLMGVRS